MPTTYASSFEGGHVGPLVTLSGRLARGEEGRRSTHTRVTSTGTETLVEPNLDRISALIVNNGATAVYVSLCDDATGLITDGGLILAQYGSMQIDVDFPWCGMVRVYSAGAHDVTCCEISARGY